MQNNFEKDVQQKMGGLTLTPSAQVWEKVEMEIAVEKRRRRGIIWFFLAGLLLLLGGGWWWLQSVNKGAQRATGANTVQPEVESKGVVPEIIVADKTPAPIIDGTETGAFKTNKPIQSREPHWKKEAGTMPSSVSEIQNPYSPQQSGAPLSSTTVEKTTKKPLIEEGRSGLPPLQTGSVQPSRATSSLDTLLAKTDLPPGKPDSAGNKAESKEIAPPTIDSAVKKKVASSKGWHRQLTVNAGSSSYADGSLFASYSGGRADASNYLSAGGAISTPALSATPSKISGGFAFSLGFSLAKSLGRRWELSFGIGYAYASTHQKVGDKKAADTTVQFSTDKALADGFYTNGGTGDYTNRFHFVEVPLNISFRPSARLPLSLSMGASYARLLHTTALTFSSVSNLYYQNKENYPRHAASLFSSVQMEFFAKKRPSLRTGPFVQYNLTKLRKENSDGTPRLVVAGLKTAVIF